MINNIFYLQNSQEITNKDLSIIRAFYFPIIGNRATILYHLLVDISSLDKISKNNKKYDFQKISKLMQISIEEIYQVKEKLEACNLVKTYLFNNNEILIEIKKPMTANEFTKNTLMSKTLISKIGNELYSQLVTENAFYEYDTKSANDVSKKFYEIFKVEECADDDFEVNFNFVASNNHEACKNLDSKKYVEYITNEKATQQHLVLINNLKKLNFDDAGINLFINYSVKINNSIVPNYILKIAKDYAKRNLLKFSEIDSELNFAINYKLQNQQSHFNYVLSDQKESSQNSKKPGDKDKIEKEMLAISGEFGWD
ncbi:hypothetical protein [Metamycoplasma hyosynoviae]|uniref:hypothetical protein n=1 Tax=Metamycoplasma hyosynoviae TaxID=29559 RepID=UPI00235856E7|nr:hypothetical protein [Metamycoplasma hyosynoviae]MDC8915496.1 hypothetical protein [Metamycoplasma hyosynoviae]MDC8918604.1 hypothetical protein [Metamycoplasma hyosynoviae]MDC8920240.1 hypothetical protein [Metamycoplasma hyosynoviae]MDD1365975.1 hypothetical protein [Metamycoplasma hyosynoviae]MDD1373399.1 hypothetical protein [Metamycoplasma hyosynoviae]